MTTADLGGPLLASVSRSFYLTIRILPKQLRTPIGLAYLLARATDTIADTAGPSAETRLRHLKTFGEMIEGERSGNLAALRRDIQPAHRGERDLIAQLDRCLAWLDSLEAQDRDEIVDVLKKIVKGQARDLERFGNGNGEVVALHSRAELDEYTYLVAGCVGEFWTRICLARLRNYAALDRHALCELAASYGKGLQLVNILRDLPADLRAGRCYLPEDELRAADILPAMLLAQPARCRPVFDRWVAQAAAHLEDGRRYITVLLPPRLRAGCFLPWYLGEKTLALMRRQPPLETGAKLKVSRGTVRAALAFACVAAFTNAPLRVSR